MNTYKELVMYAITKIEVNDFTSEDIAVYLIKNNKKDLKRLSLFINKKLIKSNIATILRNLRNENFFDEKPYQDSKGQWIYNLRNDDLDLDLDIDDDLIFDEELELDDDFDLEKNHFEKKDFVEEIIKTYNLRTEMIYDDFEKNKVIGSDLFFILKIIDILKEYDEKNGQEENEIFNNMKLHFINNSKIKDSLGMLLLDKEYKKDIVNTKLLNSLIN